jgi:hypothetical protein
MVYAIAATVSTMLVPPSVHMIALIWAVIGALFLARHRIFPPDRRVDSMGFWWEHLKMALLWPLIFYWMKSLNARVTPRNPLEDPSRD